MDFGAQLVELFAGMSIVTYFSLIAGLILIVTEFFQPSKGLFGYSGLTLLVLGILVRMLSGGTVAMLFIMVFFCVLITLISHTVMLRRHKRDWLTHSLALSLSEADAKQTDYAMLLNQDGIASTDIHGKGHMMIDEINLFVYSADPIAMGTTVRIIEIKGDRIYVAPVDVQA